ncbi:MAG: hypothetical protein GY895_02260 [Phycisphaera sp.]|nr:hypothetical protein [Phycisphaera sp.]
MVSNPSSSRLQADAEPSVASSDAVGLQDGLVGDWGAIDPLVLLAVAAIGVVLLLFGARILRPAVVLGVAALAALVGLRLAAATRAELLPAWIQAMGIPPIAWVLALPVLGGLAAIAVVRLALAALLGLAVATVVLVLGLVVAGGGAMPNQESTDLPVGYVIAPTSPQADSMSDALTDTVTETMRDRLGDMAEGLVGDLPVLDPEIPGGLRRWWTEATTNVPPATVDLVVALSAVSGICAVLLGLLIPDRVAMVGTAVTGAWLIGAAIAGAWARFGNGEAPPVVASLVVGAVLAGFGVLVQSRLVKSAGSASKS